MPVTPLLEKEAQTVAPSVMEELSLPASLRGNRPFLCLWGSQLLSQLADRVVFVVFVSIIAQAHGGSQTYNSLLYIAFTIPAILLTAIAGVYVDRWPRRMTLVTTNLLRALFMLLVPVLAYSNVWGLYALAFGISAVTQFFVPAEAATIPALVPKSKLLDANSAFTTTMMGSVIVGFALGDPLINAFSLEQVHWVIAGLFAVAALLLVGLGKQPVSQAASLAKERQSESLKASLVHLVEDLSEGAAYVKQNPVVLHAMMKLALLFSTLVAVCILAISFSKAFLYHDAVLASRKFAYMVTASGVGMALGAILVSKLPAFRQCCRPTLVYSGLLMVGLGLLALTAVPWLLPHLSSPSFEFPKWSLGAWVLEPVPITLRMAYTYGCSAFLGVGAAWVSIPLQALLHERIPEAIRGKVMGLQFTMLSTASTLPVLLAGLGDAWFGVLPMFTALAVPFLVWGLWGLRQRIGKKVLVGCSNKARGTEEGRVDRTT